MADGANQQEPQGNEPQGGQQPPQEPNEGNQATEPKGSQGQGAEPPVVDSHGQPGINKERHDREMAEKDKQIADLQAKLDEASKTEEGRAQLQKELDEAKASLADMGVTHSLEMAGCINVKAAKALLEDYGGDVAKLKDACPYLFGGSGQQGTTGLKPSGAASTSEERRKKAREAASGNLTIKR